jgi:hypothetical protein
VPAENSELAEEGEDALSLRPSLKPKHQYATMMNAANEHQNIHYGACAHPKQISGIEKITSIPCSNQPIRQ